MHPGPWLKYIKGKLIFLNLKKSEKLFITNNGKFIPFILYLKFFNKLLGLLKCNNLSSCYILSYWLIISEKLDISICTSWISLLFVLYN